MRKSFFLPGLLYMILFSMILAFTGCQREVDPGPGPGPGNPGGVNDNEMVTASVRGIVINEFNLPVEGATVTSGTQTTTTDRFGVFRFNNISISKANGYVKVKKTGYFTGSRTFTTTAGRTHNVRLRLLPKTNSGTFTASAGGTVTLAGGSKLVIPATAVTDAAGNAYSGSVDIAMTWIDPTAPNLPEIVVGDLRGITTGGEERVLETYGMIGVEMTGAGGQALKLAAGKTAELTFPVPAAILANAPATIDLWHFDEAKGRWIQEGTATKTGSNYIAQVSHFSFWNCDVPFPLVDLCMTLVNAANNLPLNNVQVRVRRANGSYGVAWTDSAGNLCGKVPKNEPLTLQVLDQCNQVVYSQNIGPFSSNSTLGTVAVTLGGPSTINITGTVTNCANANVTNGVVVVYADNTYSYSVPVTNGTFNFTMIRCSGSALNFSVHAIDLATMQESLPVTGTSSGGTVNVGTLKACGSLSEFIEYVIDGVPYLWADIGYPNAVSSHDSVATGAFTTKTRLEGHWVINNNAETTHFSFYNNEVPGTYPIIGDLWQIKVNNINGTIQLDEVVTPNPTINITAFGPAGTGYIEGNFDLLLKNNSPNSQKTVTCYFKVKR